MRTVKYVHFLVALSTLQWAFSSVVMAADVKSQQTLFPRTTAGQAVLAILGRRFWQ